MQINKTQITCLLTLTNNEIKKLEESRNTNTESDYSINIKIDELNKLFSILSLAYFDATRTI